MINSPFQLLLLAVAREARQGVVEEAEEGLQRRPAGAEGAEVVVALQMSSRRTRNGNGKQAWRRVRRVKFHNQGFVGRGWVDADVDVDIQRCSIMTR